MDRAVDVLRDASIWLRSLPQRDKKNIEGDPFKKSEPLKKPEAIWSKTKEPEILIETESFENKISKEKHDELLGVLRDDLVLAISASIIHRACIFFLVYQYTFYFRAGDWGRGRANRLEIATNR